MSSLIAIDVELEVLRGFLRLAANPRLKYLPLNKYEIWAKQLSEIGKMLGGWIKSTQQ